MCYREVYTYDGITLLSLDAARSGETTYAVAYLYGEDGRPYAGVYTAGAASPVTFLIASTDRGDVAALTNTAGAVFARYTYDPYGRVLSQDANAAGEITAELAEAIAARQPLRYAGYAYDAHSATYYLSQRHYDPATARFLTKDPARDDGEESAYQYCAGDPVGKVDPTGEAAVHAGGGQFARDITREYFALMRRNFRMAQAVYRRVGGNWHAKTE
jgi:RHS repeat-associated protein